MPKALPKAKLPKLSNPLVQVFIEVVADPKNVGRLCELVGRMPNAKTKVMDKGVMWDTLATSAGYKLQKNKLTDHCRIIGPDKVRIAWGSEEAMRKVLSGSLG